MKTPPQKILIIRFSSIGDIVLTSPVVRCLKKQIPGVHIHFCTKSQYKYLVDNNPYLDKVHLLQDSIWQLIKELKAEKFDFIVDLHDNIRTLQIKRALSVQSSTYDKLRLQRQLLALFPLKLPRPNHVADRYLASVHQLGIEYDGEGLDYFIPDLDKVQTENLPDTHKKGYVAFAIGGTAFTKILPEKKIIEFCDKINRPIILLGSKEDFDRGEAVRSFFHDGDRTKHTEEDLMRLGKKTSIFNACGLYNVNQSASIIKNAEVVFSPDTGLAHIAAALKKTVYSIWGGTVPMYFYPFETKFYILENKSLRCRPCSKNGRKNCPKKHFKCMTEISTDFQLP